ncbi:DarT1-associated NADAR antitoxin family protein [Anoxybacillus ayderensis]|uniref:DarT1-associated NADAR antitoxin family protein n=1 Tax=Anoxybacillus ayderensis TaxID=265546 RepID=UPI000A26F89E|nr:hypothetical protein [Anoxybacillus ayderensis]OSX53220.1 hypothetical protein B7H16_12735 [Anoxybacillus ayderensis]
MAKRPVFVVSNKTDVFIEEIEVEFDWFSGFSLKQKQKSIESLHQQFLAIKNNCKVLEISSKSPDRLGVQLSAFNLEITTKKTKRTFTVESAFQSSKVFEKGGPYRDIIEKNARDAKKDGRLQNSGALKYFDFFGEKWDLEPKTLFYDWLYINALSQHKDLVQQVVNFNAFTDIEFNPQKSFNCQAKSAALFVSLYRRGILDKVLSSRGEYKKLFSGQKDDENAEEIQNQLDYSGEQLSIFDYL